MYTYNNSYDNALSLLHQTRSGSTAHLEMYFKPITNTGYYVSCDIVFLIGIMLQIQCELVSALWLH